MPSQELYLNNYSHPIVARASWPFLEFGFSFFAAACSVFRSIRTSIESPANAYLSVDAAPKVTVSDKISVTETILAEF
jgi:hypothetical protein